MNKLALSEQLVCKQKPIDTLEYSLNKNVLEFSIALIQDVMMFKKILDVSFKVLVMLPTHGPLIFGNLVHDSTFDHSTPTLSSPF